MRRLDLLTQCQLQCTLLAQKVNHLSNIFHPSIFRTTSWTFLHNMAANRDRNITGYRSDHSHHCPDPYQKEER